MHTIESLRKSATRALEDHAVGGYVLADILIEAGRLKAPKCRGAHGDKKAEKARALLAQKACMWAESFLAHERTIQTEGAFHVRTLGARSHIGRTGRFIVVPFEITETSDELAHPAGSVRAVIVKLRPAWPGVQLPPFDLISPGLERQLEIIPKQTHKGHTFYAHKWTTLGQEVEFHGNWADGSMPPAI